jgi:hypothetical protein
MSFNNVRIESVHVLNNHRSVCFRDVYALEQSNVAANCQLVCISHLHTCTS